jgi:hypothetical protein
MRVFADQLGDLRRSSWLPALLVGVVALIAGPLAQQASAKSQITAKAAQAQVLPPASIAARQKFFGTQNVDPSTGAVRPDRVIMSWAGVGTFAASLMGHVVLLDDWIPRAPTAGNGKNPSTWAHNLDYVGATPAEYQALAPEAYFIGHFHNDHGGDAPSIVVADPSVPVYGAQNHCDDLKGFIKTHYPSISFNCFSLFPTATFMPDGHPDPASLGIVNNLPANTIPGVSISVLSHDHSMAPPDPVADPPFDTEQATPRACDAYTDFPPSGEPATAPGWNPPPSGIVSQAWQFRVGDFSMAWEDTTGYDNMASGNRVATAWASLPPTDVLYGAIAVSGRSVLTEQLNMTRPKIFIPIHHDPCAYDVYGEVVNALDQIPAASRPQLDLISDPGDFLRPEVWDPTAKIWSQNSNPPASTMGPTSTPVPNPGPSGATPHPFPTPTATPTPKQVADVPTATLQPDGYTPSGADATSSQVGVAVSTNTKSAATIAATTTSLLVQIGKAKGTTLKVKVGNIPAAGTLKFALAAQSGKKTVSLGSSSRTLKRAGAVTLNVRLSKSARKLLAAHRSTKAMLKLTYKPAGAIAQSVTRSVTVTR